MNTMLPRLIGSSEECCLPFNMVKAKPESRLQLKTIKVTAVSVAVEIWLDSSSTEPIPSGFGYSVRERKV